MAALAVLGASDMFSIVIRMTLVQLETPDAMRGRVSAVNTLFVGTANRLGDFRAGLMAAWLGTVPAVLIGGVGILMVVVIWAKAFPGWPADTPACSRACPAPRCSTPSWAPPPGPAAPPTEPPHPG